MEQRSLSWLEKKGGYLLLSVKVQPNSPGNVLGELKADELQLRIKGVPEKGKVNKNLIRFLSKELKISQQEIEIIQGETSRHKRLKLPLSAFALLKVKVPGTDNNLNSGEPF